MGQLNALALPFQLTVGGLPAGMPYAGLAPGYTGLYQFNITVPAAPSGNAALTFTLNGIAAAQKLSIAVGN